MDGQRKATAWCGRLLLFAALLLGIVTMHTLGHPTTGGHGPERAGASAATGHGMGGGAASSHEAAGPHTGGGAASSHKAAGHDMSRGPAPSHGAAPHTAAVPDGTPRAVSPAHGGMDPMSVCLAVLGAG
ncbi:hypothetical protein J7E86_00585, partial [Streptomyces sp. ISL-11]|nr:hypothetical protein [Streptomyces sp. ISL-11]